MSDFHDGIKKKPPTWVELYDDTTIKIREIHDKSIFFSYQINSGRIEKITSVKNKTEIYRRRLSFRSKN